MSKLFKARGTMSKKEFEAKVPDLRVDLLNAQFDLLEADFPVFLVLAGDDRVGANQVLKRIHEWMDPRYIETHVRRRAGKGEGRLPRFHRWWSVLPPKGKIGLFFGGWPLNAIADRLDGKLKRSAFEDRLEKIRRFEKEQSDDGALILKLWIHAPKKELEKRLKAARKDPDRHWWVDDVDWEILDHHDEIVPIVRKALQGTSTEAAPWHAIDGTDERFRDFTVGRLIQQGIVDHIARRAASTETSATPPLEVEPTSSGLADVDLDVSIEKDVYRKRLRESQRHIYQRGLELHEAKRSAVLVFEGWDAGGKGGAIRRLTQPLPAQQYRIIQIAAPTDEEKARHYLWRFWRKLPSVGKLVVFDRSWYGRVLVERVEGFATEAEWSRAYGEIRDFEEQLVDCGWPVLKFWLHIDPDEQLRRFEARRETAYKKYKLTEEDYRNRDRWSDYEAAVDEMIQRTSTKAAPWHVIPANDKRYARVHVARLVAKALK